jgi:protein-S-isoprenylcysteine O-methyltransferase Ste14
VDEDTRSALYVSAGVLAVSFFRLNPAAVRFANYFLHSPLFVSLSAIVVIIAFALIVIANREAPATEGTRVSDLARQRSADRSRTRQASSSPTASGLK